VKGSAVDDVADGDADEDDREEPFDDPLGEVGLVVAELDGVSSWGPGGSGGGLVSDVPEVVAVSEEPGPCAPTRRLSQPPSNK
jgi:hypothetical protein